MAHLVRSFQTYARNRSLTTGTFNRIFKDRIADRLSGANSVQPRSHAELGLDRNGRGVRPYMNLTVLETLQTYRFAKNPVNACVPQNFHGISTSWRFLAADRRADLRGLKPRQEGGLGGTAKAAPFHKSDPRKSALIDHARRYGSSALQVIESTCLFWPCEGGRQKVEKRTYFGGPCLEGTLRRPTLCFRIKPRGRGD